MARFKISMAGVLNPEFVRAARGRGLALAWMVWGMVSLFYAYQFILRVLPSAMVQDLMVRFQVDAATFGQFSGVYYVAYAAAHIPIGIMLDRFGPRRVLAVSLMMAIAGLLPLVSASLWIYPMMGRVLIGIGSSAAILGVFKVVRLVFVERYFTRMLSFSVTIGLLGGIYGGGPVRYLCAIASPEMVVKGVMVLGLGLLLAILWLIPDTKGAQSERTPLRDVLSVLMNGRVVVLCFFAGCMVGPLEGFADIWGPEFLRRAYDFAPTTASYVTSAILLGMCFGAPVLSAFAEKVGDLLGVVVAAGLLMCVIFAALIAGLLPAGLMLPAFVVVGVCCAYQILVVYQASTYVAPAVASLTNAMANMIIMSFGYVLHAGIGIVITLAGGPDAPGAYAKGIAVIPMALALGVVGLGALYLYERSQSARHRDLNDIAA